MNGLVPLVVAAVALAVTPQARCDEAGATQKPALSYAPGLGDFMTAAVQPHHIKLWLAGSSKNWPLAEYEAAELRETFEDVVSYQANWHDYPIAKLVENVLSPALSEVEQAIREQNSPGFAKSFERLTNACNTCHHSVAHPFLVIKIPSGDAYPNQEFTPR